MLSRMVSLQGMRLFQRKARSGRGEEARVRSDDRMYWVHWVPPFGWCVRDEFFFVPAQVNYSRRDESATATKNSFCRCRVNYSSAENSSGVTFGFSLLYCETTIDESIGSIGWMLAMFKGFVSWRKNNSSLLGIFVEGVGRNEEDGW